MYGFIRNTIRWVVNKLVKFQLGFRKCIKYGRLALNFTPNKTEFIVVQPVPVKQQFLQKEEREIMIKTTI